MTGRRWRPAARLVTLASGILSAAIVAAGRGAEGWVAALQPYSSPIFCAFLLSILALALDASRARGSEY